MVFCWFRRGTNLVKTVITDLNEELYLVCSFQIPIFFPSKMSHAFVTLFFFVSVNLLLLSMGFKVFVVFLLTNSVCQLSKGEASPINGLYTSQNVFSGDQAKPAPTPEERVEFCYSSGFSWM